MHRRGSRPLEGIRVLDLSQVVSGPICGRMLADLGADVVKLEPPEGDVIRFLQPQVGDDPVSVYFTWVNAGKRSISLDLRTERGAALVARSWRESSDVVLENFRPGVLEKYGLDAAALRRAKPELVYCSINGWGGDNSWSQRRAYAAMVQAEVGPGRARRPVAQRAAGAESARRRRHHPRAARGDRASSPRCSSASAPARASTSTSRWPRRSSTPTSGPSTDLAGYDGPRIPDTWNYPIFRSPTAPTWRSWATRTAAARDRRRPHRRAGAGHGVARRGAADPRRPLRAGARLPHARGALRAVRVPRGRGAHGAAARRDAVGARAGGVRGGGAGGAGRRRALPLRRGDDRRARPAPRFGEHTRAVLAECCGLSEDDLDQLEADGVITSGEPARAQVQPYRFASTQPRTGSASRTRARRRGCASRASARAPRRCGPCRS